MIRTEADNPTHLRESGDVPVIVVGYDDDLEGGFSSTLEEAVELGARLDARLHVLHAVPTLATGAAVPMATGSAMAFPIVYPSVDAEAVRAHEDDLARELARSLTCVLGTELDWTCEVRTGETADVLAETAGRLGAQLVVVGARSRGFAAACARLVNGSTVRELEHFVEDKHEAGTQWSLVIVPHRSQLGGGVTALAEALVALAAEVRVPREATGQHPDPFIGLPHGQSVATLADDDVGGPVKDTEVLSVGCRIEGRGRSAGSGRRRLWEGLLGTWSRDVRRRHRAV